VEVDAAYAKMAIVKPINWPRLAISLLIAGGLVIFVVGFAAGGNGRPEGLPAAVVSFSPGPGDRVLRQTPIQVELAPIYTGALIIDGQEVVLKYETAQKNILTFQAGKGTEIEQFSPGTHSVRVEFWKLTETRDQAQSYFWEFATT
jgi:hypothetical protein